MNVEDDKAITCTEIKEALDTNLGANLQVLEGEDRPGQPLWDGHDDTIAVRHRNDRGEGTLVAVQH